MIKENEMNIDKMLLNIINMACLLPLHHHTPAVSAAAGHLCVLQSEGDDCLQLRKASMYYSRIRGRPIYRAKHLPCKMQ